MRSAFHNWVDIIDSNSAFAKVLQNVVEHAFGSSMRRGKTLSSKFERMWTGYQQLVTSESFLTLGALYLIVPRKFLPLFSQVVTRKLMDEVVKVAFPMQKAGRATRDFESG